ncbi:hypothetical protein PCANB_001700 [Pneumocystis canis]|nr:hypothetical protein PCK1_002104 [Pneumocystis canis]KAG5440131.1 hypothetical protein PCANB_001700 [Pneumocystis canis]
MENMDIDPWTGKEISIILPNKLTKMNKEKMNNNNKIKTDMIDTIILSEEELLTEEEKRGILQSEFIKAASYGDIERIESILHGKARNYIDLDGCDETGGTAIIFASCFGHQEIVEALLEAGANIHVKDKAKWSPLMWAMNNHHGGIVKLLLAHGASFDGMEVLTTMRGISNSIDREWYDIGNIEPFESQMIESELQQRMDMQSSFGIETDLTSFNIEMDLNDHFEKKDTSIFSDNDFIWNKCLLEQTYVFSEDHILHILNMVITDFQPSRSVDQKIIPANVIFLSIRYAYYYGTKDMLNKFLHNTLDCIRALINNKSDDMTILAFWISNCTLLLYYIKKDPGLLVTIIDFQLQLTEIVHIIYSFFIQESKSRIEKHLDDSIIHYSAISAHENVAFENEWRIFPWKKRKNATLSYFSDEKYTTPSPLLITILLSSIFFVLDVYNVHPVIFKQIISQIFYWLSMELFNRIIREKIHLSRSKAMDIRLNISIIEDWARENSYQFEKRIDAKFQRVEYTPFSMYDCLKNHMAPLIQLLQWLQCVTSLNNIQSIEATIEVLNLLTSAQLLYVVKNYRLEVNEKKISKEIIRYLSQKETKNENIQKELLKQSKNKFVNTSNNSEPLFDQQKHKNSNLLMNAALMLPFTLPTGVDLLVSYDSRIIETNKKKQKCFIPVIPSDFMDMLIKKIGCNNENHQMKQSNNIESINVELNNETSNVESVKNDISSEISKT